MENLLIYKVYHHEDLLKDYPFIDDGLRCYVNTQNMEYGPYLNEYCALLENYKNIPEYVEYIGLEHYRRSFDCININNYKEYLSIIGNKNICLIKEIYYVIGQSRYLTLINLSNIEDIINEYLNIHNINISLNDDLLIRREIFIMYKKYLIDMITFVNNILQYIFNQLNIHSSKDIKTYIDHQFENRNKQYIHCNTQNDKYRLFSYVIEYLISLWIMKYMKYIPINKIHKFIN